MRGNSVKRKLKEGRPSLGTWLSLANVPAARVLARAGFDWLTVDIEHSAVDIHTASVMFGAIADAGRVALARVPSNRHDHIKRALDCGAMGVVVPMINSRDEAIEAVAACLYPPRGTRSVGGSLHALNFDCSAADYFRCADEEILIVLQCEHAVAVERADEIFSVPGIDAIFVGPNDLAASYRGRDGSPPNAATLADAHDRILAACRRHGVAAGFHCSTAPEARSRWEQGWQFLAVGSDLRMMSDAAAAMLAGVGLRGEQFTAY